MSIQLIVLASVAALIVVALLWLALTIMSWRVVVDTNKVHIVQSGKKTISFGVGSTAGNVYYRVPSMIPFFGVSTMALPTNNFQLKIEGYKAYDKDRVPFDLDVIAFFRIADTNMAANRVQSFEDLQSQLLQVVQGAVRKILASHDIHSIMTDRATFGDQFTAEVRGELKEWGVEPVKNLELIDIRDEPNGNVITSIMAVTQSLIEANSRKAVAENEQLARSAEIAAKQTIAMSEQTALQQLGERVAAQQQAVGIAKEKSEQAIKEQLAITKIKEMEVVSIQTQRQAEIDKNAAIVKAEQAQQTTVIAAEAARRSSIVAAEAAKETAILNAAGALETAKASAESTRLKGEAEGKAKLALEMAPVNAQLALAKEIGENEGYQTYLVKVREVEANQAVGVAQAEALKSAELKVFANTGSVGSGLSSFGDILSTKGGTGLTGFLSGLAASKEGKAVVDKLFTPDAEPDKKG